MRWVFIFVFLSCLWPPTELSTPMCHDLQCMLWELYNEDVPTIKDYLVIFFLYPVCDVPMHAGKSLIENFLLTLSMPKDYLVLLFMFPASSCRLVKVLRKMSEVFYDYLFYILKTKFRHNVLCHFSSDETNLKMFLVDFCLCFVQLFENWLVILRQ